MGLKAKLRFEDGGMLAASVFYAVVGVICFVVLVITDLGLIHIGLLGVISLATAYGLFRRRSWALWSVYAVAVMVTVFAVSLLYFTMGSDVLIDAAMVAYLIFTWIFAAYVAAGRKKLEF